MARGGARPGAGRPAGKSANTYPPSTRARARARDGGGNQRPWPADKVERWGDRAADPVRKKCQGPHGCSRPWNTQRLGRRPVSADVVERIRTELVTGAGILKTAKALGVGTGTVHRVKREMAATAS
jgi:hypothetical protein